MRLLIVEDDLDGGEILRELFTLEGFDVAWARTGAAAIELAKDGGFEAALVDLSLPDMEGTAVLFALRRSLPHAGLALVTGFPPATLDGEIWRTADRVFEKPIDPDVLLAFVQGAIEARGPEGVDVPAPPA